MKSKFVPVFFFILSAVVLSCHKTTVGYLHTEQASYSVDSLVIKLKLDTAPPSIAPNPTYQALINSGLSPATLYALGISPTIMVNAGADYDRNRLAIPWTSNPLEGLQGTMPITISITNVNTDHGNIAKLKQYISIRNNGVVTIPLANEIPAGYYVLTYMFKNEGYTKIRYNIFTVIVR
jgi:hypothetical protein